MFEQSQRTQHAQQVLSQSFYSQPQSFYPLNEGQPDNKLPQCYDLSRELPPPLTVPTINPWKEPGRLVEALSYCGAVFISTDEWSCPYPSFPLWKGLWKEALLQPGAFKRRPLVSSGQLRFSQGEDLLRTMSGSEKIHTPDVRYNFGLGLDTLRQPISDWGDLHWLREEVGTSFNVLSAMLKSELFALGPLQEEPPGSLGALVARGFEYFNGSRMRHCVYPAHGSCTEHTDYGLVTFQQSTAPGLEALLNGEWMSLDMPDANVFGVVFAGDMLERVTNGKVRALVHRVNTEMLTANCQTGADREVVRQSQILFLQPDRNTVVQPFQGFRTGDPSLDYPPVRYGDWHKSKTSLAFRPRLQ